MNKATLIRTTFNWGWLTGQRFSPLLSRQEHDSIQADGLEELKVLHLDPKADRQEVTVCHVARRGVSRPSSQ